MDEKKVDRRVRYTVMMLKAAMVEALQKEQISRISVKSLCEMAGVNRSTFYAHFDDQYDLLHSIESEALDNVKSYLKRQDIGGDAPISFETLSRILAYIKENAGLFHALFSGHGGTDIHAKIFELTKIVTFTAYEKVDERARDYFTVFGVMGCVSILQKWLSDGTPESTAEIAGLILKALNEGVTSFR